MFLEKSRVSALACLVWVVPAFAAAQSVESSGTDQISVDADGERLGDLLRKLSELGPVEQLLIDEVVEGELVTVKLESAPFSEALLEVLQAANVNYVIRGGNGKPYQVYAGRGGTARGRVPPPAPGESADDSIYDLPYEKSEAENYEAEDPFPEISGEARLSVAPSSATVALAGAFLAFGLLSGTLTVGRSSSARTTRGGKNRLYDPPPPR